jgi:predicted PurR-regulated permease PerM
MQTTGRSERLGLLLFYGFIFLLLVLSFLVLRPFLVPLGWAAILAVLFYPLLEKLKRLWGDTWAALAGTVGVTVILIVPGIVRMLCAACRGRSARAVSIGSCAPGPGLPSSWD